LCSVYPLVGICRREMCLFSSVIILRSEVQFFYASHLTHVIFKCIVFYDLNSLFMSTVRVCFLLFKTVDLF